MTCEKIQEILPAYQDGELSAENEQAVKTHLEGCEVCRREANLLSASWEMLGEMKPIAPSPDFEARFWARLRQEESNQTGWRSWLNWEPLTPWAVSLAGIVVIWMIGVTGGLILFKNQSNRAAASFNERSVLTSPYPQNSIEQIFMESQKILKEKNT